MRRRRSQSSRMRRPSRCVSSLARAQHERLRCELDARERALELVRYGREEILLTAPQLRVMPDRAREHRHAAEQHGEEEAAFPHEAVDARRALVASSASASGRTAARAARDRDVRQASSAISRGGRRRSNNVVDGVRIVLVIGRETALDVRARVRRGHTSNSPPAQWRSTAARESRIAVPCSDRASAIIDVLRLRRVRSLCRTAAAVGARRAALRRAGRRRGACARATGTRSRTPTARARCRWSSSEWKIARIDAPRAFGSSASAERGASSASHASQNIEPSRHSSAGTGDSASAAPSDLLEIRAERFEPSPAVLFLQHAQRREPGRHRDRIARQRAGLVDAALAATSCSMMSRGPPNAPTGMPPPMTLPNVARSGLIAVMRRRAAGREPEAGDHLVEDQQRAVPRRTARAAPCKNSARCSSRPLFAGTGSMITAAMLVAVAPRTALSAASCRRAAARA